MIAQHEGRCPECGEPIRRGDPIVSSPGHGGRWTHDGCADYDVTPEGHPRKGDLHPVCRECWIMHPPGECP